METVLDAIRSFARDWALTILTHLLALGTGLMLMVR